MGRGLSALLGRESFEDGLLRDLSITEIRPSRLQPRSEISEAELAELAASIRDRGVLQPILVRPLEEGYELVAGERRWRAAVAAGMTSVPAIVRRLSDQESLEVALLENLQREDLNPLERARAYRRLHSEFGMTQEQIAVKLRKSQSSIANTLRLLQLPHEVQLSLEQQRISEGHARALLALAAEDTMRQVWQEIERRGLSVRQTEHLVRRNSVSKRRRRHLGTNRDPNARAVEEALSERLKTKVSVRAGRRGGTITLAFYSPADLDRLVGLLLAFEPQEERPAGTS